MHMFFCWKNLKNLGKNAKNLKVKKRKNRIFGTFGHRALGPSQALNQNFHSSFFRPLRPRFFDQWISKKL